MYLNTTENVVVQNKMKAVSSRDKLETKEIWRSVEIYSMDMRKQDGITLIEKIATTSNLVVVCEKVYKNKGAAGLDGITVYEIDEHMAKYQKAIIAKLLDGTYEPQPFKRVSISKGNGSMRNLGIPVVRDRVVQQAILQIIEPPCTEPYAWWCDRSEPVGSSYSIVPGRGGINWLVLYDYLD